MVDAPHERLVVEPVGPAGCGKTTLLRALLERSDQIVAGVRVRLLDKARSWLRIARLLGPLLPNAIRHRTWFTLADVRSMIYLDAWSRSLRKPADAVTIVLLDHGPIFRLARLSEFGPPGVKTSRFERWWEARLADWGNVLDLVVWLDAPEDLLLERIHKRKTYHLLKDQSDDRGRALLLRYRRSYERVLDKLADHGRTTVVRFDTSRMPADLIAETVLSSLIQNGGSVKDQSQQRHDRTATALPGRDISG